jgi:hypothetical protein
MIPPDQARSLVVDDQIRSLKNFIELGIRERNGCAGGGTATNIPFRPVTVVDRPLLA